MELQALPEGCIATTLSLTTPTDVCRLSLVSKIFRSAAEYDSVWDRFLPSNSRFISSITSQSPLHANAPSKKALYLALSDHPAIIDEGKKSFQLEKNSGKKCYMLAARALFIVWGGDERYWNWTTMPDSRFPEVAVLRDVCWLEIRGVIKTLALSPNTQYAAYLVFKMVDARGFHNRPVELSVGVEYAQGSTQHVCLDPNAVGNTVVGLQRPSVRSDGWLEIEMGEFFISGLEDEEMQMRVVETKGGNWKRGLVLEGIEVRPKEHN